MSKTDNRASMPGVAALVDEFRAVFPDLKVVYAEEGGKVIDRREPETNVFTIPKGYGMPAQPKKER